MERLKALEKAVLLLVSIIIIGTVGYVVIEHAGFLDSLYMVIITITTIGYGEDVQAMPENFEYAQIFHSRWYRPNNVVLIVAGDVEPQQIFSLAEKYYAGWEANQTPKIPELKEPVNGPKRKDLDFPTDVPPWVAVSYSRQR